MLIPSDPPQSRPSLPPGWNYRCPDCADKNVSGARSWVDCIYSVLLNLQEIFADEKSFHHREEICEYINSHWRPLCGLRESMEHSSSDLSAYRHRDGNLVEDSAYDTLWSSWPL